MLIACLIILALLFFWGLVSELEILRWRNKILERRLATLKRYRQYEEASRLQSAQWNASSQQALYNQANNLRNVFGYWW
jgi:hypothetical protein